MAERQHWKGTVPVYIVDPDPDPDPDFDFDFDFDGGRGGQRFYVEGLTETGFCEIEIITPKIARYQTHRDFQSIIRLAITRLAGRNER